MNQKKIHVISHSHWDREWYMPFEHFRMRLVKLIDDVIDLLETDPGFKSFHLDGHVLLVDDYLEIRPEREEVIRRLVQAGKLVIGPWYVLQDAFLTSGEAQIRNLQLGLKRASELGGAAMIGYFPDTFGNISQSAQILRGFDIKSAVFGRGIQAILENNRIKHQAQQNDIQSELKWASPDGSDVLSIYLANWYHNAMELSVEAESARERAEVIAHNTERFATTRHLLWMNGCDHQPVQRNVAEAIAMLNQTMGPDYEAVHSSFPAYIAEVEAELQGCETVTGELTGQLTNGWGSLVNTASSRMILKQWNARLQRELEKWAEPFSTISAALGKPFPAAFIRQAWKYVLQNHPHDSICGCSVDEVHEEMMIRYKKADQIASAVTDEALRLISGRIESEEAWRSLNLDATGTVYTVAVFNAGDRAQSNIVHAVVEVEEPIDWEAYTLHDPKGQSIPYRIEDQGRVHGFTLPDDQFRIRWIKHRYRLSFNAMDVPGIGHSVYFLARHSKQALTSKVSSRVFYDEAAAEWTMRNENLRITVKEDGRLSIVDLNSGQIYNDFMYLEDVGDIGNEYEFRQSKDGTSIVSLGVVAEVENLSDELESKLRIIHDINVPIERECEQRAQECYQHRIALTITLEPNRIDVEAEWINQSKDHRLRVLFPSDIKTDTVYADAPFDVVARSIIPWEGWENPSRCERMQSFFALQDSSRGIMIAADGLPEYEILQEERRTMALTLLRSVGEMGDWNYFSTPNAQCLSKQKARFSIIPYSGGYSSVLAESQRFLLPLRAIFGELHEGSIPAEQVWLAQEGDDSIVTTSLKWNEDSAQAVWRYVNMDDNPAAAVFRGRLLSGVERILISNLSEKVGDESSPISNGEWCESIPAKKIATRMIPLS